MQADIMWAHVEYLCDKNKADVPIAFFENYENVESFKLYQSYNVFWSPIETDTPSKIMDREHKILFVDEIKNKSSMNKSARKNKLPLAGYYKAILLKLAGSEEELQQSLEEERTRKPTDVVLDGYSSNVEHGSKTTAVTASQKRKFVQEHQKKSRERNLKNLGVTTPATVTDPVKSKYSIDDSESEDENVEDDRDGVPFVQYADLQEKYDNLKKKYKNLECNLQKQNDEVQQLRTLNLFLQMELKKASEDGGMRNENKKVKRQDLSEARDEPSNITSMKKGLNNKKVLEEQVQEASTSAIDDNNLDSDFNGTGLFDNCHNTTNINCNITEEQFKAANKVIQGIGGDSRFVKNICDIIWTREELAARSAMGKACPNKQGCEARPECTPAKKQYLQDLLERRIDLEHVKMSFGDREKRTSKVAEYIRAKIKAVRRAEGPKD